MHKLEFLQQAMSFRNFIGYHFDNFEYAHHFYHIVESNNLAYDYYTPIKNIGLKNAADSVYVSNNELNFFQLKTKNSHNKFIRELYYQDDLKRYHGYCNTLQYAFFDYNSYAINEHVSDKIDLSFMLGTSDKEWESFVNTQLDIYKDKHCSASFVHYNELHNQIYYDKKLFYGHKLYE